MKNLRLCTIYTENVTLGNLVVRRKELVGVKYRIQF